MVQFKASDIAKAVSKENKIEEAPLRDLYWVSFRINEADRDDYHEVYKDFEDTIVNIFAINGQIWKETTSFIVFRSNFDIDTISIALKTVIDDNIDLFIIRKMNYRTARICGNNNSPLINQMIPYLITI
ncbi:hypothetical protein [Nitrospirillum viridazoti]|uniref:hypothetical protein n=1 Tax=Nitrospirillum viridazoti TaxID=3144925 RepID=UPI00110FAFB7|nr:hypothetical protein [Nitrospirillum amazonense]